VVVVVVVVMREEQEEKEELSDEWLAWRALFEGGRGGWAGLHLTLRAP